MPLAKAPSILTTGYSSDRNRFTSAMNQRSSSSRKATIESRKESDQLKFSKGFTRFLASKDRVRLAPSNDMVSSSTSRISKKPHQQMNVTCSLPELRNQSSKKKINQEFNPLTILRFKCKYPGCQNCYICEKDLEDVRTMKKQPSQSPN